MQRGWLNRWTSTLAYSFHDCRQLCNTVHCCAAVVSALLWQSTSVSWALNRAWRSLFYYLYSINTKYVISRAHMEFLKWICFLKYIVSCLYNYKCTIFHLTFQCKYPYRKNSKIPIMYMPHIQTLLPYTNIKSMSFLMVAPAFTSRKIHISTTHILTALFTDKLQWVGCAVWIGYSRVLM